MQWGHAAVVFGLLALPACNQIYGLSETTLAPSPPELDPGGLPRTYAIFCEIERSAEPRRCATAEEVASGAFIPQSRAAVALNTRETGNVSLDYSADATAACGGLPQVVTYEGSYPEGSPTCLKYIDVVGVKYSDPNEVCIALCNDLNRPKNGQVPSSLQTFCIEHARASTNFPIADSDVKIFGLGGFLGACSPEGALRPDFDIDDPQQPALIDPRRVSDPVKWDPASLVGVAVTGSAGNNLTRTLAGTVNAGAAGTEIITRGDAYLEFAATETDKRRRIGLAFGTAPNPTPGPNQIEFGIELGSDGIARVVEGSNVRSTFGPYTPGQVFRVRVTADNGSGTATVSYSALMATCLPGTPCAENVFYTHTGGAPVSYPLHIDSSIPDEGGTLTNVRILRIK
jgi:hypothetical protein